MLVLIALRAARALRIRAGFPEPLHLANKKYECTINSDFFARILLSRITLKHLFATIIPSRDNGCDLPISEKKTYYFANS